ncbi:aluminum-activated malate transporter 7-like [Euphorbia lathyris]|uniref:aluminum-activated malate transporter 7-like n=1 Tax=Euphorbia lathyris TaxID=212925 RepID=UPI003313358E
MAETSRSCFGLFFYWIMYLPNKLWGKVIEMSKMAKKLGKDDPRRIVHAFKVGLALTLVSLFYYFNPLYEGLGFNAIWAVLTVVVVFEFSVGATLGKAINRMWATVLGGGLGLGCHRIATLSGRTGEPILLATFVFIIAFVMTYTRFFPTMKRRYDYGLLIFILTFSLVSVSGYRDSQIIQTAHMRVSTIIIGSCSSVIVCICICPVWIGQDLHNLVLGNIEKLGVFLLGFGNEYFKESDEDGESDNDNKSFLENYKGVLTSKTTEENMANFAKWEPGHGKFKFFHPWKQYLKIGNLSRECAYKIETLYNNLHSEFKSSKEIRSKFSEACKIVSMESGKALEELGAATKKMQRSRKAREHIENAKTIAENVKSALKINEWEGASLVDIVQVGTVCLVLLEIIQSIEKIEEAINELANMADFDTLSPQHPHVLHSAIVQPIPNCADTIVITVRE